MEIKAEVVEAKRKWAQDFLQRENVIGVAVGKKIVGGVPTDEDAVIVLVKQKQPVSQLKPSDVIPLMLGDVATDVWEVGEIVAFQDPQKRWRPAPGGVSLGHYRVTAGTLGATVEDAETGERLILSNNHVIALSNNGQIGDAVLQPGPADGGTSLDEIGKLHRFIPIAMDSASVCPLASKSVSLANRILAVLGRKTRLGIISNQQAVNVVDCAVAKPNNPDDVALEILVIGKPKPDPTVAFVGMEVQKFGRTTGYTKGKVIGIEGTVNVNYGSGRIATFEHQIISDPISAGGDSGDMIWDMENRPVGLLFAGSDTVTIMNEIGRVLDALKIRFPA